MPLDGINGKINPILLKEKILCSLSLRPHMQKPGCISITQATECGTIYTIQELNEIHKIAKEHNMPIHMDGARFANSIITLNCTPAELTWQSGIDVMSFGATKNGAMCAEAIIFFNHKYAENFDYMHKRAGQLMSKSRFFACQFLAYLEQDLWLQNATNANFMAQKCAQILHNNNIKIMCPVEANELFISLPIETANYLRQNNYSFYEWGAGTGIYRFVTSCFTTDSDIENLAVCLDKLA